MESGLAYRRNNLALSVDSPHIADGPDDPKKGNEIPMFVDPSAEACACVLQPYHDRLFTVPHYALTKFSEIPDQLRLPLEIRKRAFANTMWAFQMEAVESLFAGEQEVILHPAYESILAEIGNTVMLRWKKVDEQGFSSSYPTQRARWYNDASQGELFDRPTEWSAPIRLDLGYHLARRADRLRIESVRVIRRSGKRILWQYTILPPGDTDSLVSSIHPTPRPPRIVPRDGETQHLTEEGK